MSTTPGPARPITVMYSGWQVSEGTHGEPRVGDDLQASIEFLERTSPLNAGLVSPRLQHIGSTWYRAIGRVVDVSDAVVLDLGPFSALRWLRAGSAPATYRAGTTVALELTLSLNAWGDMPWTTRAGEKFGTGRRWRVDRITRMTVGRDDPTEIPAASADLVDPTRQYCLLDCTLADPVPGETFPAVAGR